MMFAPLYCRIRFIRRPLLLAVLALSAGTTWASHKVPHQESKHNERHEIEAMEEQWRTAQIAGDLATIDRLLSDDFVGISITGQANTKQQQLDRFRTRRLILNRIDLDDRKIKLLGAVAIVTSLARVEGSSEGEAMQGTYRYTRIYQRISPGMWKTTNFEATRVPPERRP